MPPPETKSISFAKPSLLTLNPSAIIDMDKAMIPTPLRTMLKDISGDGIVGMVLLPQFGYLYVTIDDKLLDYEVNLLDNKLRPFRIVVVENENNAHVRIAPRGRGTPVLFDFGEKNEASMEQAKMVAKEMETLLGYPIIIQEA
jgi:hypothetical protein